MITFGTATPADRTALKALWLEAFEEDSSEDVDGFLHTFFEEERALVARDGTRIVAMLFLLPQVLCLGNSSVTVGYVYGGATARAERGQGLYRRLLEYAAVFAARRGMKGLFLRPADDRLADSYRRMGFTVPMRCGQAEASERDGAPEPLSPTEYGQRRRDFLHCLGVPFIDWDTKTLSFIQRWCVFTGTATSVALIGEKNGEPFAWECFGDLPPDTPTGRTVGDKDVIGLMRWFDGEAAVCPSDVYMGYGME